MTGLANGLPLSADFPPLRLDEGVAVRVGKTRVSLDLIVEQYENGMAPEDIVRAYDTLALADVHAVIAYYLRHRDVVRAYLKRRDEEAETLRLKIEAERPRVSHEELVARRAPRRRLMLRLASDADVHGEIIRGLRRRLPEIDLVRAQDVFPEGTPDPEVLAWAATEKRVLITNDRNTMVGFAYQRSGRRAGVRPHRHDQRAVHRFGNRRHPSLGRMHVGGRDQGPSRGVSALPIVMKQATVRQQVLLCELYALAAENVATTPTPAPASSAARPSDRRCRRGPGRAWPTIPAR